jgi:hypothetical protein
MAKQSPTTTIAAAPIAIATAVADDFSEYDDATTVVTAARPIAAPARPAAAAAAAAAHQAPAAPAQAPAESGGKTELPFSSYYSAEDAERYQYIADTIQAWRKAGYQGIEVMVPDPETNEYVSSGVHVKGMQRGPTSLDMNAKGSAPRISFNNGSTPSGFNYWFADADGSAESVPLFYHIDPRQQDDCVGYDGYLSPRSAPIMVRPTSAPAATPAAKPAIAPAAKPATPARPAALSRPAIAAAPAKPAIAAPAAKPAVATRPASPARPASLPSRFAASVSFADADAATATQIGLLEILIGLADSTTQADLLNAVLINARDQGGDEAALIEAITSAFTA